MNVKCITAFVTALFSISVTAHAGIQMTADGSYLIVSGDGAAADTETVLIMLKKGVSAAGFLSSPQDSDIEYFWQTISDNNGGWSFSVFLDDGLDHGDYEVIVSDGNYSEQAVYHHVAENNRAKNEIAQRLNAAKNADELKAVLMENSAALGLFGYTGDGWNVLAKTLMNSVGSFTYSNLDALISSAKTKADGSTKPVSSGGGGGSGGSSVSRGVISATASSVSDRTEASSDTADAPYVGNKSGTSDSPFSDLDNGHYAYTAISSLSAQGIVSGVGDGRFEPDRPLKREEFAKFIVNAFGIDSGYSAEFEDVSPDAWYYDYVSACCGRGVIMGYSELLFGTGDPITREDACVMLYRLLGTVSDTPDKLDYTDYDQISGYASEAVDALSGAGVINGMDNGCFEPKGHLTRAQAAVILYNIQNRKVLRK